MASDAQMELYVQNLSAQSKYVYFLLAAAASALAFAVQKSDDLVFSWQLAPLGVAAFCWMASFYLGVKCLQWSSAVLQSNYQLIQLQHGTHPKQPPPGAYTEAAKEVVRNTFKSDANTAASYGAWQLWMLTTGALAFIVWHVLAIYLRSNATQI